MTNQSKQARLGLSIFLGLLIVGSAPLLYRIISSGTSIRDQPALILGLMWVPAVASIAARLANGEGFGDLSFKLRDRTVLSHTSLAILFPVAVGLIAYGAAWASGLVTFGPPGGGDRQIWAFLSELLFAVTVGATVGVLSAAGEEIGWRGYMVPRMIDAGIPAPFLVGGLVWGFWHVPAIVTGQYAAGSNRLASAGIFVVLAIALTVLWSTWTLQTGSIWPAILGHAAWNAVIQGPFDAFSSGPLATTVVGESGAFVVVTTVVLVALLVSNRVPGLGPAGVTVSKD